MEGFDPLPLLVILPCNSRLRVRDFVFFLINPPPYSYFFFLSSLPIALSFWFYNVCSCALRKNFSPLFLLTSSCSVRRSCFAVLSSLLPYILVISCATTSFYPSPSLFPSLIAGSRGFLSAYPGIFSFASLPLHPSTVVVPLAPGLTAPCIQRVLFL